MTEIVVPNLGESVTEATVAKWLKRVGDVVAVDDPLVELETDKVSVEVPSPAAGTLREIAAPAGADVEVGGLLGTVADGEGAKAAPVSAAPAVAASATAPAPTTGAMVDVAIPDLGESITEGTLGTWLKSVGDAVAVDDPLVEVETDKVTAELPSPVAGTLAEVLCDNGTDVEVGTVVARIARGEGTAVAVSTAPAAPSAPASRPAAAPAPTPAADGVDYPLAPAVRKLIDEHGLDPAAIPATGKDGRLTKGDVLRFIAGGGEARPRAPAAAPAVAPVPAAATFVSAAALPERPMDPRGEERVRMTKLRQTIARRLKEAQNAAAMLTTFNEVDMTAAMTLRSTYRDAFEKRHGVRLGFMSFFVKAVIGALKELPAVNAEIHGDELIYKNYYDIGIAVGSPMGLVVPVLRDADSKSFAEIETGIADFGLRARDGKLGMQEMMGGTFTITNGGVFGSLLSTPILNPPQSGILGMHKIQKRPMVVGDKVEARPMMYLALSYDHRIVDGREAVTFLVCVKDAIEDPQRLLIGI